MNKNINPAALAVGATLIAAHLTANAQATYARGESVWTNTSAAVGLANCLACHTGAVVDLAGLRSRFSGLTQAQVRARVDSALNGNVAPMTGLYAAMPSTDREALSVFLGNFIGMPSATAAPTALNAMSAAVGTTTQTTMTIANAGRAPLTIANMAFGGAQAGEFNRMPVGNGCLAQTIAPGSACQESIRFAPAGNASGLRTATLILTHDGSPGTTALTLSGTVGTFSPAPAPGPAPSPAPPSPPTGIITAGALGPWAFLLLMLGYRLGRRLHLGPGR